MSCVGCNKCCKYCEVHPPGFNGYVINVVDFIKLASLDEVKIVSKRFKVILETDKPVALARISGVEGLACVLHNPCAFLTSEGCLIHDLRVSDDLSSLLSEYGFSDRVKPLVCRAYPDYVFKGGAWVNKGKPSYCSYTGAPNKALLNELIKSNFLSFPSVKVLKCIKEGKLYDALKFVKFMSF